MIRFALALFAVPVCLGAACGQPPPPSLQFDFGPVVGYSQGFTCQSVTYKNCPGVAKIEITIYESRSLLGIAFEVPAGSESHDANLPQGSWGANIGGLRKGTKITRASAKLTDKNGDIIVETRIKADYTVP